MKDSNLTGARALIYARISQNREDDAAKPQRQIDACRHLIKAKELSEAFDPYTDDDVSAYRAKMRRPAYEEVLDLIEAGEVDVIVTWHIDRMLRTVKEMVAFIELAERTGVRIESVQGGSLDLSTPAGRLMATILAAVAQAEAELKSERHKLRNIDATKKGKSTGGPVPFGWSTSEQTAALKRGVRGYLAGDSLSSIAKDWNDQGLRTTFGHLWNQNSVRKVLTRPRNAGLVEHRGEIVPGAKAEHGSICTEDEWRRCVAIAESNKVGHRPPEHLLSNLLRCSNGHPMMAGLRTTKVKDTTYRYDVYRCKANGCLVSIRRDQADDLLRTYVRSRLTFEDIASLAPSTRDLQKAVDLRARLGELRGERNDLEKLLADRAVTVPGYRKAITPVMLNIEDTEARLAKVESENAFAAMLSTKVHPGIKKSWNENATLDELVATPGSLNHAAAVGQRFDSLPLDQRRAIVRGLFPKIEVLKVGKTGKKFKPEERITAHTAEGRAYVLSRDDVA